MGHVKKYIDIDIDTDIDINVLTVYNLQWSKERLQIKKHTLKNTFNKKFFFS